MAHAGRRLRAEVKETSSLSCETEEDQSVSESLMRRALCTRANVCGHDTALIHTAPCDSCATSGKRRAKHSPNRDPPSVGLCQRWKENMYLSSEFQDLDLTFAISLIPSYVLHQTTHESLCIVISIVRNA